MNAYQPQGEIAKSPDATKFQSRVPLNCMKLLVLFLPFIMLVDAKTFQSKLHRVDSRGLLKRSAAITPKFVPQKIGAQRYTQTPLFSDYDSFFVMNVSLGTPPQWFTLLPTMKISNMFVVDAACNTEACKNYPESGYARKQYDPSKSTTYEKQGDYFELTETVYGYYAYDTMQIGKVAVKHQEFGLAESAATGFGFEPIDGFFGIGLPDPTSSVMSPIQNFLSQFEEPIFTIWLDAVYNTSYESKGGMMTFGGVDSQHCDSQVTYAPVQDRSRWQFKIDGIKIGDYSASVNDTATIELGNVMIYAPTEHFSKIMKQMNATCDGHNLCKIKCSAVPQAPGLTFDIRGAQFTIPASEYTWKFEYSGEDCDIAMDRQEYSNSWVLGSPFMRKVCSVFDVQNEHIGFAKAINA